MEGLTDPLAREFWTAFCQVDSCTTEFIRISHQLLPEKVFLRDCPELENSGRTKSGTPVALQLLGGDPSCMAENAARAAELGAPRIDLNFGCPAPAVNKNEGGARLLENPDRVYRVVEAVRKALPIQVPLSSKIRLGYLDESLCLENALATAAGGSMLLTVHCRTKADMYRPPAKWSWIPQIRAHLTKNNKSIPILANGEIWSLQDFLDCQRIAAADGYVLGRGLIANPLLAIQIRQQTSAGPSRNSLTQRIHSLQILESYFEHCREKVNERYTISKVKQIFRMLHLSTANDFGAAAGAEIFQSIRAESQFSRIQEIIKAAINNLASQIPEAEAEQISPSSFLGSL